MYELLSQISAWISGPFSGLAYSTNFTILTSFLLGFVGSVALCQISANLGAVAYFGNRYVQQKASWFEILLYLLGKVAWSVVYFYRLIFVRIHPFARNCRI